MKKKLFSILLIGLLMIPYQMGASTKTYTPTNLEEALTQEQIEHDLSKYQETDDQAIIYLFRGNGCSVCRNFLTFLNSIVDEYGKYFKVVSYEVWYDQNNSALLEEVADFLDVSAQGVPFIVIGDQVFPGYLSSYDEQIKTAIKNQYDSKNSYDVMKELEKAKNKMDPMVVTILWNLVFITSATTIILLYLNSKNKQTIATLEEMSQELKAIKKNQSNPKETLKTKKKVDK